MKPKRCGGPPSSPSSVLAELENDGAQSPAPPAQNGIIQTIQDVLGLTQTGLDTDTLDSLTLDTLNGLRDQAGLPHLSS